MAATKHSVTKQKYYEIKKQLHTPKDDAAAMKKFGLGASTIRNIRNTKNYDEYTKRNLKKSTPETVLDLNNLVDEVAEEIAGELKAPRIEVIPIKTEKHQKANPLATIIGIFLVLCMCAVVGAATYKFLGWVFGF